ncbi:MAG: hypothetical protein Q7S97_11035 [Polaromonas sp.]|nr:hypothetical protein [Polaromonas sp.]
MGKKMQYDQPPAALLVVIGLIVWWLLLRQPITFLKVPTSDSKASASSLSRALK